MLLKIGTALACLTLFVAEECGSKPDGAAQHTAAPAASTPAPAATATGPSAEACRLIEPSEVASVQGFPVSATQPSARASGEFAYAQCHYTVVSPQGGNFSVHVEVQRAARPGASVAGFWQTQFREAVDKRKSDKPKPIAGVGDEAYWAGNSVTGSLYALRGDRILRVSAGGGASEQAKIEKAKKLAQLAIKRLG